MTVVPMPVDEYFPNLELFKNTLFFVSEKFAKLTPRILFSKRDSATFPPTQNGVFMVSDNADPMDLKRDFEIGNPLILGLNV